MGNMIRHRLKKQAAIESMGGACQICGYNRCNGVLHFHHINLKDKDFSFSCIGTKPWDVIVKELKKCILVCANCHGEIHNKLTQIPKSFVKYDSKLIITKFTEGKRRLGLNQNWQEVQKYYDDNKCSVRDLSKKFNMSAQTIATATKQSLLIQRSRRKFSKEQIVNAVSKSKTCVEAFKILGMRQGGKSNNRLKKWISEYGIDISHFIRPFYKLKS